DLLLEIHVLLGAGEADQAGRVALEEERVDDRLLDVNRGVRRVDRGQRLGRAGPLHQPEVADRRLPQLRILLVPGELDQLVAVAADEHGLEDRLLRLDRRFGLVQLRELAAGVHHAELTNRLAAQARVGLGLGGGGKTTLVAGAHSYAATPPAQPP